MNFELITWIFEEIKMLLLTINKTLGNNEVVSQREELADTSKMEGMIRRMEKLDIFKVG